MPGCKFRLSCNGVYNGEAQQNRNRAKTHTSAQTTFLLTGTAVSTFLRLLRCVARATFLHRHSGLCNFLSRSFVTFRCFCAPARRTTMATRTTLKTHTSAQTALCRQLCWPADATRLSILAHLFHHGNALAPAPLKGYGLLRSPSAAFNGPFLRPSNV